MQRVGDACLTEHEIKLPSSSRVFGGSWVLSGGMAFPLSRTPGQAGDSVPLPQVIGAEIL